MSCFLLMDILSIHSTDMFNKQNAWASHLLPEYKNIILPSVSTVGALRAPASLIKNTGAQHWDNNIWNYHLQLPPPYNTIVLGGAKSVLAHAPRSWLKRGDDSLHLPGVAQYMATWPTHEVVGWPAATDAADTDDKDDEEDALALPAEEGGAWTGVVAPTADGFPFVGPAPARDGHFLAAGFGGHGMPRILLATAQMVPAVLESLGVKWTAPEMVKEFPPLPKPFVATAKRVELLQHFDVQAEYEEDVKSHEASAKKAFCTGERSVAWKTQV